MTRFGFTTACQPTLDHYIIISECDQAVTPSIIVVRIFFLSSAIARISWETTIRLQFQTVG